MHHRSLGKRPEGFLHLSFVVFTAVGLLLSPLCALAEHPFGTCEPLTKVPRVVALGDSMTAGEGTRYGGYRGYLSQIAIKHGKPIEFVGSLGGSPENPPHEGWIGFEIRESSSRPENLRSELYGAITSRIMKGYSPDAVILFAGSNYLCCTRDLPPLPDRFDMETRGFVSKVVNDVELLLTQLYEYNPKIKVLVVSLPPSPAIHPDFIDLFNNGQEMPRSRGLPDVVKSLSSKGLAIDLVEGVEKLLENSMFHDELHPNEEGYSLIAEAIYQRFEELLSTPNLK